MSAPSRWLFALTLPLLLVGIALARGKKAAEDEPEPPVVAQPPSAPPSPPAPKLFPTALPIVVDALPPGLASLSAQTCNGCHWAAHDSWQGTAHAHAWSDPVYQAALASAGGSTVCRSCHLPVATQHDQIAAGYIADDVTRPRLQANPGFDVTLMSEGVTCIACHVRDGTVLGTQTSDRAPHPVVASAELQSSEMCATCHQLSWPEGDRPFYDTYGEWKGSAYAEAGVQCQDCHMAPAAGAAQPGQGAVVASHGSPTTIQRALTTMISLPNASVTRGQLVDVGVSVINTGAGHSVPTGNPFKTWTIEVVLVDAAGKDLAPPHKTAFARTVEAMSPWKTTADDRLGVGATRRWTASFTPNLKGSPGLGAVVVRAVRAGQTTELRRVPVQVR